MTGGSRSCEDASSAGLGELFAVFRRWGEAGDIDASPSDPGDVSWESSRVIVPTGSLLVDGEATLLS